MDNTRVKQLVQPYLENMQSAATIQDTYLDKDAYRISMATLWAMAVNNPQRFNLEEEELEDLHDCINNVMCEVLMDDKIDLHSCFKFIDGKLGQQSMKRLKVPHDHQQFLLHFANLILGPNPVLRR